MIFGKATLVHELCHRLLVDNKIKSPKFKDKKNYIFEVHKIIDLILFDIWVLLYGEKFAKTNVVAEKSFGHPQYIKAWEVALALNREERKREFEKVWKKI